MEYNNDNRTPRDRLSDDFLREILSNELHDFSNVKNRGRNSCNRGDSQVDRSRQSCNPIRVMPVAEMMPSKPECNTIKNDCECQCECPCEEEYTCGCGTCENFRVPTLHDVPLAMVYSPHQEWENIYDAEIGHSRGTIFKCLDLPFYPVRCAEKEQCRQHRCR